MFQEQSRFTLIVILGSLLAYPLAGYSHGNNDSHAPQYDAVDTEFGSYRPDFEATRTITVEMSDTMRFSPAQIRVKVGDVVRFEHSNQGQLMHEFVLGTAESLDEHAELMKRFPNMEHDEPYMAHVAPGKKGVILWQFTQPGVVSFGCLIPGHYDAGMKGEVIVEL
jgi:uncharacterized cupredoxin-like copper-binding protein